MRVLYLISGIGPPAGWGTEYIQNLIFELSKKGVNATIINPIYIHTHPYWKKWTEKQNKKPGIRIINIVIPGINRNILFQLAITPIFVTIAAIKLMLKEHFDLVHEFSSVPTILIRSLIFKIFFHVPTIYTLSVYNDTFIGKFYWIKIFNFAKYYLIPSREIISQLVKLGIRKDKVIYSPPGINLEKLVKLMNKQKARKIFNLPTNKYIVTFFGSLTKEKGVGDLLKATAILKPRFQGKVLFCFFSIWKGSKEHLGFKKRITSDNSDYVKIVDKYVDIPTVLTASDMVVLPQQTGFGATIPIISVIEAIVAKKNMISTDIIGTREFVSKTHGILVPPKDPVILAKTMENSFKIAHGNKKNKRIDKANSKIIEEFSMQRSINLHLSLYKLLAVRN